MIDRLKRTLDDLFQTQDAIKASMDPRNAALIDKFNDELQARENEISGFFELPESEQQTLTESIEKELFENIPGSREAWEEYFELCRLADSETKGRPS